MDHIMNVNKEWFLDRVKACWTGKNIGGTMGAPFEGKVEMQDIDGFTTAKGEPLPNDDLDLQLIWLKAVEERGIQNITSIMLGEYWTSYISAHWNEYGIGKANLKNGILPPFCGEYQNEKWKNSNGAWIRTEIWACLFPGYPELAVRYAYKDACIDHGISNGTYAAMFVAALESAAFFENDILKLIDIGLSFVPEDCKLAKTVRMAIDLYNEGKTLAEARNAIVKFNEDLGVFQAPANVSYVVLGLLYGEGDYKKSMISAINCGDDTDCTGATIGSIMGIMGGMEVVPEDWSEYIGDRIISVAIDKSAHFLPVSCTELTERVFTLMPAVLKAYNTNVFYGDGETTLDEEGPYEKVRSMDIPTNPYTYDEIADLKHTKVRVEFDKAPVIAPGETIKMTVLFRNSLMEPRNIAVKLHLPEGWTANYRRHLRVDHLAHMDRETACPLVAEITAGENVEMINKVYVEVKAEGRPTDGMIPVTILG